MFTNLPTFFPRFALDRIYSDQSFGFSITNLFPTSILSELSVASNCACAMNSSSAANLSLGILIILLPLPFPNIGSSSISKISSFPIFETAAI